MHDIIVVGIVKELITMDIYGNINVPLKLILFVTLLTGNNRSYFVELMIVFSTTRI